MTDQGYTLAEMLVALTLVGLASAGLASVSNLASRDQRVARAGVAKAAELRRVEALIGPALVHAGPIDHWGGARDGLRGAGRSATFNCERMICSISLTAHSVVLATPAGERRRLLSGAERLHLRYLSDHGELGETWPGAEGARLVGLVLADGEEILGFYRTPRAQDGACAFDVARHTCALAGEAF